MGRREVFFQDSACRDGLGKRGVLILLKSLKVLANCLGVLGHQD